MPGRISVKTGGTDILRLAADLWGPETALLDLLSKKSITKVRWENPTQGSKSLLASLKECSGSLQDWTDNADAQAEVKIQILDTPRTALPVPPFSESETNAIVDRIYDYGWAGTTSEPRWMAA